MVLLKCCTQYASKIGKLSSGHGTGKGQFSNNKDGHNKRQKWYGPNKREHIKKRWQKYIEDINDPDNHDGVITHLEPGILECEVKWALGSTVTNKASGGDGLPVELFQTLRDGAVKVLHSICQQIWKTQQ